MLELFFKAVIVLTAYYFIGWFLSNQQNPMLWPVYGKICFLIFFIVGLGKALD